MQLYQIGLLSIPVRISEIWNDPFQCQTDNPVEFMEQTFGTA